MVPNVGVPKVWMHSEFSINRYVIVLAGVFKEKNVTYIGGDR